MKRRRRIDRTGSTYIVVLLTSMIVSLLALTSLSTQLLHNRQVTSTYYSLQAAQNARAGLRMGMQIIESDPHWRANFGHGTWLTSQSTTLGHFQLEGYDLIDNQQHGPATQGIRLVSTGVCGTAMQPCSLKLVSCREPLSALETGFCAGRHIHFSNSKLHYHGTISANARIRAEGRNAIFANAQAVVSVGGPGFTGAKTSGHPAKELPDASVVLSDYLAKGTKIDVQQLPTRSPNLIPDGGMERPDHGWVSSEAGFPCSIKTTTNVSRSGRAALHISQRSDARDGPCYDLTHCLKPSTTYRMESWVKLSANSRVRFALNARGGGSDRWQTSSWQPASASWTKISSTIVTPNWPGSLELGLLKIESDPGDEPTEFYLDDVNFVEVGTIPRLSHTVLSDQDCAFGPPNSSALYVIDCQGGDLLLEHLRIQGTLVLQHPGRVVIGPGPVHMHPRSPDQPVLLSDGDIEIATASRGLVENWSGVNYNPATTPHPSIGGDTKTDDVYPSQVGGLIYSSGSIRFRGQVQLREAVVLAGEDIEFQNAHVTLSETKAPLVNPPQGFAKRRLRVLRDSCERLAQ